MVSDVILYGLDYSECKGFWPNSNLYNCTLQKGRFQKLSNIIHFITIIHTMENYIMT